MSCSLRRIKKKKYLSLKAIIVWKILETRIREKSENNAELASRWRHKCANAKHHDHAWIMNNLSDSLTSHKVRLWLQKRILRRMATWRSSQLRHTNTKWASQLRHSDALEASIKWLMRLAWKDWIRKLEKLLHVAKFFAQLSTMGSKTSFLSLVDLMLKFLLYL